ncbi:MAG: hypothetical protein HY730_00220 [Candidatus Tectomicrobia bacterium]|uniref:DUF7995 domain-containing protein n=1 Tax=Tectimicrobiota bacterium TaxID=2528274 RepID=A0A933GLG6_UNCTE|nr:hypothetical protein [Candidatus Tectomicrobia bacterium]
MHMLILALVRACDAEEAEEALEFGKDVFHSLVEKDAFDFFHTFDEEKTKREYGDLPCALKADSPKGKKLLEAAMGKTREEFGKNLTALRTALMHSDDKLWEEDPGSFRFYAKCLGEYRGVFISIYDEHGIGLRCPKELATALSGEVASLWIVPAMAHS